jgi:hypothetical protein
LGNHVPDPPNAEATTFLKKEEKGHLSLLEEELQWLTLSRKYFTIHRLELRAD